jgi:predicted ATPase
VSGDVSVQLAANWQLGFSLLMMGRPAAAKPYFENVVRLSECPEASRYAFSSGHAAPVAARGFLAFVSLYLGQPDRAAELMDTALGEARRLGHAFTHAFALSTGIRFAVCTRPDAFASLLRELSTLAEEKAFGFYRTNGAVLAGWQEVLRGHTTQGAALMRDAMEAHRKTGARVLMPGFLGLLASAEDLAGRSADALDTLAAALALIENTSARETEAEIHRLRGSLLIRLGRCSEGEASLQQALVVARDQGNRWWELRAATSLAKFLRDQDRRPEAQDLLVPVYASFTEGFALPDLADARIILEELGPSVNSPSSS